MKGAQAAVRKVQEAMREYAMSYPETSEEFPWGERVIKVRGKIFLFLGSGTEQVSFTVKLPASGMMALAFSWVEPTGYGLARSGWVTARVDPRTGPPVEMFQAWIDESYRAVAPKRLVAGLGSETGPKGPRGGTTRKAAPAPPRKPARKHAPRKVRRD